MNSVIMTAREVCQALTGAGQFRRPIKALPMQSSFTHGAPQSVESIMLDRCPYPVGGRLWVRETWKYVGWTDDGMPFVEYAADGQSRCIENAPDSCALMHTWARLSAASNVAIDDKAADRRWRSSATMPRWASRLTIEIVSVRVERVQDIRFPHLLWIHDGTR